ncbi:MAG: hypothetical protein KAR81_01430, partial [Sulfurimonas sp.]|nr:hypothetical protein [Sulfurimonas sp.]
DYDWVLVLLDTTVSTVDKFCGYIALKATDTESLLSLPAIDATVNWIDIGTVTKNGDMGVGDNAANPADFSMTTEELLALAGNDDLFKAAKNLVLNYNNGIYYTLRSDFYWDGNYTALENSFVNVSDYVYRNYGFQLDSNSLELMMDEICGENNATKVNLEFYPPAEINASGGGTYTIAVPISNGDATCSIMADGTVEADGTDFYAKEVDNGEISLSLGMGISGNIPQGYWSYQVDGVEKGVFDAAVATPLTDTNKISGFVPSIKINTDGSGIITTIDVKWYHLDTNGTNYVELTDISLLKHHIGSSEIVFHNTTGATRLNYHFFDPATQTSITPSNTWYYGTNGTADEQVESIIVFYESAGTGYFFEFFRL